MDGIMATVGTAAAIFAATNVDDIIVLVVLFLSSRAGGRPKPWQIWAGQYAGIAVLVLCSIVAALGLTVVPNGWVGLLGLVPMALGARGLVGALRGHGDDGGADGGVDGGVDGGGGSPAMASGPLSVAALTVANGADNISIYTPVFRTVGAVATVTTIAVFAVGVAAWCVAGSWLGSHKRIIEIVERHGRWIVPVVFIVIGALIVADSETVGRIL